ncbi:MAG: hypothetical protein A2Z72_00190 [Omnitrophica bacterium RBG_13_46_9]|nr:MAG: hypothetical protein A2Z72_00190 [Omnitrophica bacterium RBG_13_46_9]
METTKNIFIELAGNKILLITIYSWIIAQTIKVIMGVIKEKRFNFSWFLGTGGMPSSHAAGVTALASSVGLSFGFHSGIFAITLIFTLIVLFDAQGMRRSMGKQAEILNKMLDDIYWKHLIQEDRLKELLGHAPIEVFAGMALGIAVALLFW